MRKMSVGLLRVGREVEREREEEEEREEASEGRCLKVGSERLKGKLVKCIGKHE